MNTWDKIRKIDTEVLQNLLGFLYWRVDKTFDANEEISKYIERRVQKSYRRPTHQTLI